MSASFRLYLISFCATISAFYWDSRWFRLLYLLFVDKENVFRMILDESPMGPDDHFIPQTELERDLYNLIDHDHVPLHSVSSYLASQSLEDLPISVQRNEIMEIDAKDLNQSVFYHFFVRESQPLLIKNAASYLGINAYSTWESDDYFRKTMGSQPITIYSDVRSSNTFAPFDRNMKVLHDMTMNDFLGIYRSPKRPRNYYYAEREIPDVLRPDLWNVINGKVIPPWTGFMDYGLKNIKIWFGQNLTNSLPHTDPYENLLFVFDGQKKVKLVDPTRRKYVYALSNYSPVDFFHADLSRFPLFREAFPLTVTVEKGSILYIPALWWHHVVSEGRCVAVSEWFTIHSQLYSDIAHCLEKNLCA